MKRQRRTVGAVVEIDLEDGYYTYGRILDFASFAFYNIRTKNQIAEAKDIVNHPVLFIVAVYSSVVAKGQMAQNRLSSFRRASSCFANAICPRRIESETV